MLRTKDTSKVQGCWPLGFASRRRVGTHRFHVEGQAQSLLRSPGSLEPKGWEKILEASGEASNVNAKAMMFTQQEGTGQPAGLNYAPTPPAAVAY